MLVRKVGVVVGVGAFATGLLAFGASCQHGSYDGSYTGGFDGGSASDGNVPLVQTVQPDKSATLTTTDGAFQLFVNPGTFSSATLVTITFDGERTLDQGLIVPIYTVTAGATPAQPVLVQFNGNVSTTLPQNRALVPTLQAAGSGTPLPLTGTSQNRGTTGPSGASTTPYWGATKTLGTFSLDFVDGVQDGTFADGLLTSCTSKCCTPSNGSNGSPAGVAGGCYCPNATPDLTCVLKNCSDLAAAGARCTALAASAGVSIPCHPLAGSCPPNCSGGATDCNSNPPSFCCVNKQNPNAPDQCSTPGSAGVGQCSTSSFQVHCTTDGDCKTGACCVVGNETLCSPTCPEENQVCDTSTDAGAPCPDGGVDGGGCRTNTYCPFKTCGPAPAGCN